MEHQLTVKQHLQGAVRDRVEKLNRKARKLNVPEIEVSFGESFTVREWDDAKIKYTVQPMVKVTLTQDQPLVHVGEWRMIAAVEKIGAENLVKDLGDHDWDLTEFRTDDLKWCDHCQSNRNRKYAYVLLSKSDRRVIIVGKKCLGDFIEEDVSLAVQRALYFESIRNLDEDEFEDSHEYHEVKHVAECIAKTLRALDWVYDKETFRISLCEQISPTVKTVKISLEDSDIELADEFIAEWMTWHKLPHSQKNDFQHNVGLIASCGSLELDRVSWLAGSAYGYVCRKRKRDHDNDNPKEFFGELGERDVFELELTGWTSRDGQYGTSWTIRGLQLGTNNPFIWFSSNPKALFKTDTELFERVKVKATVKDQNDHERFGIQTVLTRVALQEVI